MAAPLLRPARERAVYLPAGLWQRFGSHEALEGSRVIRVPAALEEIPVFIRAGTILPLGAVVPNTAALPGGPLDVQIYPGADATFTLITDDGATLDYQDGNVRRLTFVWDDARRALSWTLAGSYDGPHAFRALRAEILSPWSGDSRSASLENAGEIGFGPPHHPGA